MPVSRAEPHPDQLAQVEQLFEHFEDLELRLQQVQEGISHSHRLATLGTITSIIAHEYNNILTPIISYAQLALKQGDDIELLRKAAQKGLEGAQRAAKISTSLLGFAREADDQHVAELRKTIDDALACIGRDPKKDGVELTIEAPAVKVAISPLSLQQVMVNLILNALQAMSERGGQLRISAHVEGALAHLQISDTGPGIPPQIMDRLFEPFVTCRHGERDSDRKGTGLGLCICRDLIRNAGGTIHVNSKPNEGATFTFTLPVADELLDAA